MFWKKDEIIISLKDKINHFKSEAEREEINEWLKDALV